MLKQLARGANIDAKACTSPGRDDYIRGLPGVRRLLHEFYVFLSCPRSMRTLLATNMVFGLALPVVDIFLSAYIMRMSQDVRFVVGFQLALYTGIPLAFLANGFLLGRIAAHLLYSVGMLLVGASLLIVMWPDQVAAPHICSGLFLGVAYGFFASNRAYLALVTTDDRNRNYYYGVEMFCSTSSSVVVPLAVGWLISGAAVRGWFGGVHEQVYALVAVCVFALCVIAALICRRGRYPNPPLARFCFFRFQAIWYRMLTLALLKGLAQGYIVTAPAMLVLGIVGEEGLLGTIQSLSGVLSAFLLYGIGRHTAPHHRVYVFAAGLLLFALGGLVNAWFFGVVGTIALMACLMAAKPLLDLAYFPIHFRIIDKVSAVEGRPLFAYLLSHEYAEYAGRFLGCGLFLVLATKVSTTVALRYALAIVGLLQLMSLALTKGILTGDSAEACDTGAMQTVPGQLSQESRG